MKKITVMLNIVGLGAVLIFSFQNCSGEMSSIAPSAQILSDSSSGTDDGSNQNEGPKPEKNNIPRGFISQDCINEASADTCVVLKNPVAYKGASISGGLKDTTSLYSLGLQNFAVKLNDLDNSGFLQNEFISVDPSAMDNNGISRLQADANDSWMHKFEDEYQSVNQLMSYYWINEIRHFFDKKTQTEFTAGAKFIIDSHHNVKDNAYFSPSGNTGMIAMGYSSINGNNHHNAISGDVLVHESCHGFLHFASNGNAQGGGSTCSSKNGCLGAIHEGQADFCAYIMFPDKAGVGESFMNSPSGFSERNYNNNQNITADQMFSSSKGEIHNYGALYASMWMAVWKSKSDTEKQDIEKIFAMHLAQLTSRDNFVSSLTVIRDIADAQFSTKTYSQDFQDEWTRRGL